MISPLCCGATYISDDIFCSRVTSGVTASIRRAVGVDVLKVDLLPKEVVSAHCEAEERGRPRTSRLGGIHFIFVGDNHDHEGAVPSFFFCSNLLLTLSVS